MNIAAQSIEWKEKFLNIDHYLRSLRLRHCILIESDLRQFNGLKYRIDAWETLCSPVRECDSVGNFSLISDIYKSKRGKSSQINM